MTTPVIYPDVAFALFGSSGFLFFILGLWGPDYRSLEYNNVLLTLRRVFFQGVSLLSWIMFSAFATDLGVFSSTVLLFAYGMIIMNIVLIIALAFMDLVAVLRSMSTHRGP